jgi:hypothetical protein
VNTEILDWPRIPWEVDKGEVKKTGRDEPIGVIKHGNNTRKLPV